MAFFGLSDSDRPDKLQYNFGYNLKQVGYDPSQNLLGSIGDLQNMSQTQTGMGDQFAQQYQNMIDPNSGYMQKQYGELRKNLGSSFAQSNRGMQQAMAQRGMGKGGMANLLGAVGGNQMGEQVRKGMTNIQDVGLQRAGQFGQLATGAYGSAGNMMGKVGDMQSVIDARGLQTDMANASAQNAYNQWRKTMSFNQYAMNTQQQNAYNTQQSQSRDNLLGQIAQVALFASDIRLKDNVKYVGKEKGHNLYEFSYKWDKDKKYIGVMAQDILDTHPKAVTVVDGYYAVDYSKLNIELKEKN